MQDSDTDAANVPLRHTHTRTLRDPLSLPPPACPPAPSLPPSLPFSLARAHLKVHLRRLVLPGIHRHERRHAALPHLVLPRRHLTHLLPARDELALLGALRKDPPDLGPPQPRRDRVRARLLRRAPLQRQAVGRPLLRRLVDRVHEDVLFVVDDAIQDAAALDGKSERAGDVGLERVGSVAVKGDRGAERRVGALDARLPRHHLGHVHVRTERARIELAALRARHHALAPVQQVDLQG